MTGTRREEGNPMVVTDLEQQAVELSRDGTATDDAVRQLVELAGGRAAPLEVAAHTFIRRLHQRSDDFEATNALRLVYRALGRVGWDVDIYPRLSPAPAPHAERSLAEPAPPRRRRWSWPVSLRRRRRLGRSMDKELGRLLIIAGAVLVVFGAVLAWGPNLRLGRLPGDISISRGGLRVYIPLGTCLVVSIVLTVLARILSPR
jgi:hypothetical protein